MNSLLTVLALSASVVLEVVLELKGVKVPDVVLLLSGFAVRHIIGGDTVKDVPIKEAKNAISSPINPIA